MICENCGSLLEVHTVVNEEERLYSGEVRQINLCEVCREDMINCIQDMYADEWGEY